MQKVSLVVPRYLQKNIIFNENSPKNRDAIFDKYIKLKSEFTKSGYDVSTCDINSPKESDIVIYFDMPKTPPKHNETHKSYLILIESELIRPDNYDKNMHRHFQKIFTWDDRLVDEKKYFKLNFSHKFPEVINKDLSIKERLCTLVAGNKKVSHPLELYSERVKAIRWFERNHPEAFDLYGIGWDRYRFGGAKIVRALNKVPHLGTIYAKITKQSFPSYKGAIQNKKEVMERYRFSICYENAKDIPGYITEKIFDSFFAGCIPIYWGADNIETYIPKECFIDKRDFQNYSELYSYISTMPDETYKKYLDNIESFLTSDKSRQFTTSFYAQKIVSVILESL